MERFNYKPRGILSIIYMEVTADRYELPVRIAGSARELARLAGVKEAGIYQAVRINSVAHRGTRYVRVELREGDDDE